MTSVAVVQCGSAVADYLKRRDENTETSYTFSFAHQTGGWESRRWHVGVFVATTEGRPAVTAIGLVGKGNAVTSLENAVNVERAYRIGPAIPIGTLAALLGRRYSYIVAKDGPLTKAEADRILNALRHATSTLAPQLDLLCAALDAVVPQGRAGELLGQQKDAAGVLLEIGGFHRGILRQWQPQQPVALPFMHDMPERSSYEDQILAHDAAMVPEWLAVPVEELAWRGFTRRGGSERMFIANVNHHEEEEALGVDLIYYHEQHRCFVLVQYKRLEKSLADSEWGYRPDRQLRKELKRMRIVDQKCTPEPGDSYPYRLVPQPCWIKLCEARPLVVDSADLIPGMYLPREAFEHLIDSPLVRGPRGGSLLTYSNVPRHLNNTTFTSLVGDGWLGTTGRGTELVHEQIVASMQAGRTVMLGVHDTDHEPGNRRRRMY